jgi:hypothetical protein
MVLLQRLVADDGSRILGGAGDYAGALGKAEAYDDAENK